MRTAPYFRWYQWTNQVAAALLLVPGIPIMAVLVMIVRLTSRGPGLYRQERVGMHGRRFTMFKIRTMRSDAEDGTGAVWAQPGDARVTFFGRIFRALHLDELPQLWNVLKGEMALMGPRPERPEFTDLLERDIPGYAQRLVVLPGITGLAQINLPPDSDLDSVRRKLVLDLEYIETATLWLDFRIAMRTLLRLVSVHGDWPTTLLGLHRTVVLPSDSQEIATPPPASNGKASRAKPVAATALVGANRSAT